MFIPNSRSKKFREKNFNNIFDILVYVLLYITLLLRKLQTKTLAPNIHKINQFQSPEQLLTFTMKRQKILSVAANKTGKVKCALKMSQKRQMKTAGGSE